MAKKKPSLNDAKLRAIQAETEGSPARSEELRRTTVMLAEWQCLALEERRLLHKRARRNMSVSALIREAISEYLKKDSGSFEAAAKAFESGRARNKARR